MYFQQALVCVSQKRLDLGAFLYRLSVKKTLLIEFLGGIIN